MKVWELIAKLSECPAGANVNVGIAQTLNVAADDVEVCKDDGDTVWLSSLCADE